MSNTQPTITPQVGKRYVTRGGWVTPPLGIFDDDDFPFTTPCGWTFTSDGRLRNNEMDDEFDLITEYVEPTVPDTFRRDLIARIYVAMIGGSFSLPNMKSYDSLGMANVAIKNADTLIEAMEAAK